MKALTNDEKVIRVLAKQPKGTALTSAAIAKKAKLAETYMAGDALTRLVSLNEVFELRTDGDRKSMRVFMLRGSYKS